MTCIVALREKDTVFLGGDSAGSDGDTVTIRGDAKVFRRGPMLFGFAGSFRMGDLLHYKLALPQHAPGKPDAEYIVSDFIEAVRTCLKAGGFRRIESNVEVGGTFIIVYRARVYQVFSDFQVGIPEAPFCAIGCGECFALGALHILERQAIPARRKVVKALEAAARFSDGVREPFHILTQKG